MATAGAMAVSGQEAATPIFRTDSRLVLVNFAVTHGREAVLDLKREDVQVFEGREERKIAVFETPRTRGRTPLEAAFLLDVSGSVTGSALLDARVIEGGFLAGLERGALISIYSFAKYWKRHCALTRDAGVLAAALEAAERAKHNGTRLFGSIAEVAEDLAAGGATAQRVLFVVSDGFPYDDDTRAERAVEAANRTGVRVFPILLRHTEQSSSDNAERDAAMVRSEDIKLRPFVSLGEATGGRSFDPDFGLSRKTMGLILASTASLLNVEYTVGYYAEAEGKGRAQTVSVRLRDRRLGRVSGGTRTVVR